jgi:RNA polymerase sigma factor (sigma-70 family)
MPQGDHQFFNPTSWTKLRHAAGGTGTLQEECLNSLAEAYRRPLLELARIIGISESQREDAVQEVMASVFSPVKLSRLHPGNGQFRSYLAAALRNSWLGCLRRSQQERRDVRRTVPFDETLVEQLEAPDGWQQVLDAQHAVDCLNKARAELEGGFAAKEQFTSYWKDMLHFSEDDATQKSNAEQMGVDYARYREQLSKLRRQFRQAFKKAVAAGVLNPPDLDAECVYLLRLAVRQR